MKIIMPPPRHDAPWEIKPMSSNPEGIVTAYAEGSPDPRRGKPNIWIIFRSEDGSLREECWSPEEQTPEMQALATVSQAAHTSMVQAAARALQKEYA